MEDCFWSLFNTTDQLRIDGIRTLQLQGFLSLLARHSLDEYLVWQEGTNEWVSAQSVYDRLHNVSQLISMPPVPPEVIQENVQAQASGDSALNVASEEPTNLDLSDKFVHADQDAIKPAAEQSLLKPLSPKLVAVPSTGSAQPSTAAPASVDASGNDSQKSKTDVRMSPRFLISFKAFVTYEGRVMKNETVNVSVGGMKLKTPLDADAEGSVAVLLMHNNQELNMTCKILKDEGSSKGASRLLIEKCNRLDILRNWILSGNHRVIGYNEE